MNSGIFGEGFPYSNFHDLNTDWIIQIAKDFLDQYTHIQDVISDGLTGLQNKYDTLQSLLDNWYITHSEDIANQLADALESLNEWYITHQNYLNQTLNDNILAFNNAANLKTQQSIESIPPDYTTLTTDVRTAESLIDFLKFRDYALDYGGLSYIPFSAMPLYADGKYINIDGTLTNAPNHKVIRIPGDYISRIFFHITTLPNLTYVATQKPDGTFVDNAFDVIIIPNGDYNAFYGTGLPKGSYIYFNWYNANAPTVTSPTDGVYVKFVPQDKRITNGLNVFNKDESYEGILYGYTNGTPGVNAGYCCNSVDVTGKTTLTVGNSLCHIAFYDTYGIYLSGEVNTNSGASKTVNIPANATMAIISPTIDATEFYVTLDNAEAGYSPFHWEFKQSAFKPYQEEQIHFKVPVNQTVLGNGANTSDSVDSENIINVNAVLKLPTSYDPEGNPVPAILIAHGAGYYVGETNWGFTSGSEESTTPEFNAMIDSFVSAGYAVFDVNGHNNTLGLRNWGCPRTLSAYRKAYEYIVKYYNIKPEINVYGFSMGGITALNFAYNNPDIVKAIALSAPVTHLYDQAYCGSALWKQQLADAYGFVGTSGITFTNGTPTPEEQTLWNNNAQLTVGCDPSKRALTINNVKYIIDNLPTLRAWHGTADTAVSYTYTQQIINQMRNAGHLAQIRLVDSGTHAICYGGSVMCNQEYTYYFNRFN